MVPTSSGGRKTDGEILARFSHGPDSSDDMSQENVELESRGRDHWRF